MSPKRRIFANAASIILTAGIVIGVAVMIYLSQIKEQLFPVFFPPAPVVTVDEEMTAAIYQQIDEEIKVQEKHSEELKFDKFASKKKLEAIEEEQRKVEEARKIAEEKRKAEARRIAEEKRKAEERRIAEEKRKVEEKRLADLKKKEEEVEKVRLANVAEAKRLEDLKKKQAEDTEKKRLDDERKKKEDADKKAAEEKRKAEEVAATKRKADADAAAAKAKADAEARAKATEAENYRRGEAYLNSSNTAGAIQQALYNKWSLPSTDMSGYRAIVVFYVDLDGNIVRIDEGKSKFSGFAPFDNSVRAAINRTKKIKMPNDKNAANVLVKIGVQVTFDPVQVGF